MRKVSDPVTYFSKLPAQKNSAPCSTPPRALLEIGPFDGIGWDRDRERERERIVLKFGTGLERFESEFSLVRVVSEKVRDKAEQIFG